MSLRSRRSFRRDCHGSTGISCHPGVERTAGSLGFLSAGLLVASSDVDHVAAIRSLGVLGPRALAGLADLLGGLLVRWRSLSGQRFLAPLLPRVLPLDLRPGERTLGGWRRGKVLR